MGSRTVRCVRRLGLSAAVTRSGLRVIAGCRRSSRRTRRLRVDSRQSTALHHRLRRIAAQRRRRRGTMYFGSLSLMLTLITRYPCTALVFYFTSFRFLCFRLHLRF